MAVSDDGEKLSPVRVIPTKQSFSEAMDLMQETAESLLEGKRAVAMAGGAPGPLDAEKTQLINAPNITDWNGKPLAKELAQRFQCPVMLDNDCVMAGIGEALYGSGQGKRIAVYMTISTGVGGARIVNGKIDENAWGFEPGHQIISIDGSYVSLENSVSGTAIRKKYNQDPAEIKDEKIWDEIARLLAIGLNNTIVHWSPDIVILGGSVMKSLPVERVRAHLKEIMKIFPVLPAVEKSALGDEAGLHGALSCMK